MFSTVDSPAARFLRIHLDTGQGGIAVLVPDHLRKQAQELRTTGSEALAGRIARSLAEGTWVRLRLLSAVQYYRGLLRRSATSGLSHELTAELGHLGPPDDAVVELPEHQFVRMLRPEESPDAKDAVLEVEGVRVELWRYHFDPSAMSLYAKRLVQVRSARPE
jgi:hypothetical protein